MNKLLTTPKELTENPRTLYTGNHYLSLPEISPQDASVSSLNIVSLQNKGLVELRGEPYLLKPVFFAEKKRLEPGLVESTMEHYHIPKFTFFFPSHSPVEMRIYPDLKEKGLIYAFATTEELTIQLKTKFKFLNLLRFNSHPVEFKKRSFQDRWLQNPVLDIQAPQAPFALAFGGEKDFNYQQEAGDYLLELKCQGQNALYISLNSDPDGASTNLIHLKRLGYQRIYQDLVDWLLQKKIPYPEDIYLEEVLNLNLFFNYFFAVGKDLQTDNYIALTSRSPRYYVSGAFWERDSFLWSFPALRLIDQKLTSYLAGEMIVRHSTNAGDHAHYLDGTVLYPGFELDQAASYFLLLDLLPQDQLDGSVLKCLEKVLARIEDEFDPESGLYQTFLLPSDDPSDYPFVTIDQAILASGFQKLASVYRRRGLPDKAQLLEKRIAGIKEGVWKHLVKKVDDQEIFAWSTDAKGNYLLYNDPPGNLGLLPFYGFVTPENPVFINTIDYYYSPKYRYYPKKALISELACDHHPNTPSGLGLCASILNPLLSEQALSWLKMARMDHGLLAESFDANTGEAKTGVAFATGSGYLAYALYHTLIKEKGK